MSNSPKNSKRIFVLSPAYVEMLHDFIVAEMWPGQDPISPNEFRNPILLSSAVLRPFQSAFSNEIFPTIFEKSAALFHALISDHPFLNGNKRTAVVALDHFLAANDYFLSLSNEEALQLARETATYRTRGESHDHILGQLEQCIRESSIPLNTLGEILDDFECREYREIQEDIRTHPLNGPDQVTELDL